MELILKALWALAGAVFGAGVAYGTARGKFFRLEKDVNGLGACMRENFRRVDRQLKNFSLGLFIILDKREDRQRLADLMREQ